MMRSWLAPSPRRGARTGEPADQSGHRVAFLVGEPPEDGLDAERTPGPACPSTPSSPAASRSSPPAPPAGRRAGPRGVRGRSAGRRCRPAPPASPCGSRTRRQIGHRPATRSATLERPGPRLVEAALPRPGHQDVQARLARGLHERPRRPPPSRSPCTALATATTSANEALPGSRSKRTKSGRSRSPTREAQTWKVSVPWLTR